MDRSDEQFSLESNSAPLPSGNRLSRRSILGGFAAVGATAAAVPLMAGCDNSKGETPPGYGTGIDDGFHGKVEL
ncbi:hypothetical protein ABZ293_38370, partial [Nocardia sp. NPDC005998]